MLGRITAHLVGGEEAEVPLSIITTSGPIPRNCQMQGIPQHGLLLKMLDKLDIKKMEKQIQGLEDIIKERHENLAM